MTIRFYILILCLLASCLNVIANGSRSKVVDLGRIIYSNDESALLRKMQGFEGHTNVAVKIYTTFRLNKAFDIDIIYTTELSGDNSIAIVVQTGWWSTLTDDYEPSRYKDDLHIDRTENLNKQNLLPAAMVEEIRKRMVNKFLNSTSSEQSKNLYYSLDYGVELLASLIYNPVAVKGSLIWESLWNRTDPYIMPEIAGFIDGCYNTYKSIPETDDAVEAATEVARDFAFNYALNRDGYRDAVNNLVTEALTDLDTYIKLANGIVAAEDKIVNIYKGTTQEDRYWRGIVVFEVASAIFPLSKTKTAAKSASGIRGLLDDLKRFKIGKLFAKETTLVKYSTFSKPISFGGEIIKASGKRLNILGRVFPSDGTIGTKALYNELISQGVAESELSGLFTQMPKEWKNLSIADQNAKYWKEINKVHIDKIIADGGDIRFIQDPRLTANQWNYISSTATDAFSRKARAEGLTKLKTFLKMEYDYLVSKGYVLNDNGLMIKQ